MDRAKILQEIKQYFDIEELVCDHILARWGEDAWKFLDTGYLANLLVLRRDVIQQPMYCNNHKKGVHQRGMRCNLCELVKEKNTPYLSAHVMGKAGDFSVKEFSGLVNMNRIRTKIRLIPAAFPVPMRLEKGVTWLHIDVMPTPNGQKIYEFEP